MFRFGIGLLFDGFRMLFSCVVVAVISSCIVWSLFWFLVCFVSLTCCVCLTWCFVLCLDAFVVVMFRFVDWIVVDVCRCVYLDLLFVGLFTYVVYGVLAWWVCVDVLCCWLLFCCCLGIVSCCFVCWLNFVTC